MSVVFRTLGLCPAELSGSILRAIDLQSLGVSNDMDMLSTVLKALVIVTEPIKDVVAQQLMTCIVVEGMQWVLLSTICFSESSSRLLLGSLLASQVTTESLNKAVVAFGGPNWNAARRLFGELSVNCRVEMLKELLFSERDDHRVLLQLVGELMQAEVRPDSFQGPTFHYLPTLIASPMSELNPFFQTHFQRDGNVQNAIAFRNGDLSHSIVFQVIMALVQSEDQMGDVQNKIAHTIEFSGRGFDDEANNRTVIGAMRRAAFAMIHINACAQSAKLSRHSRLQKIFALAPVRNLYITSLLKCEISSVFAGTGCLQCLLPLEIWRRKQVDPATEKWCLVLQEDGSRVLASERGSCSTR